MRFELFIASRYLRAKRRQAFIGVITGISIAGVAAGVASLVIALAINNGFRQDLQDRLLGSTSHINLLRVESDGIKDWRPLMDRLAKQPHVVAAAPAIYEQVLISRGPRARGAVLKGLIPGEERKVSDLLGTVKIGSAEALDEGEHGRDDRAYIPRHPCWSPATCGCNACDHFGQGHGGRSRCDGRLGRSGDQPAGGTDSVWHCAQVLAFSRGGIFSSGFYDYDFSWAFARLSDAQQLFGLGDEISVLEFKVDDIYQAGQIAKGIEQAAGKGFMATNWMEQNKAIFRALRLERLVTFITIGLIVFVAALNILISLTMMVMEKTRDIAVLMSMGTRKSQVRRIFVSQGVLIGVIGTAIGLVLGYALSWAGGHYHLLALAPEVYSIDYVPFAPRAMDGVLVAVIAIAISLVATIYPSWSAARILPAEALRYE